MNEWIGAHVMQGSILMPLAALVFADAHFFSRSSLSLSSPLGQELKLIPGMHFGSQYPGNPATDAVYDFLPQPFHLSNTMDLIGAMVFDVWLCNADERQCIFTRDSSAVSRSVAGRRFTALLIDNSHLFNGAGWNFKDEPEVRKAVPRYVSSLLNASAVSPWIEMINQVSEKDLCQIVSEAPEEWVQNDKSAALELVHQLQSRRERLLELVLGKLGIRD